MDKVKCLEWFCKRFPEASVEDTQKFLKHVLKVKNYKLVGRL